MQKSRKSNSKGLYFPERITKDVMEIFDYPLTIVEAPMGYGKTTAVREHLESADANILWQRVYDGSITGFWTGFCNLFGEVDPECAGSLLQLGFPNDSGSRQEALNIIMKARFSRRAVLVIDDFHTAEQEEIDQLIEYLVWNEIPDLNIVLTARHTSFQNLEEMKLKGYLKHITKDTFEFDPKAIKVYFKTCGISLKEDEVKELYSYTEGWISALYLSMLDYKERGRFITATNIDKLVEKAVYEPLPQETKDFLNSICIFESFDLRQAEFILEKQGLEELVDRLVLKNAFISYDRKEKIYAIHSIFRSFLQEKLEGKRADEKEKLYQRAAQWFAGKGDSIQSTRYYYLAGDFSSLLSVVETDKGRSFNSEYKHLLIKYLEECPAEYKEQHPVAMLVYARRLFTYNEIGLFRKVCGEFMSNMQKMNDADIEYKNRLLGEFELLLSFTGYNDIEKMSEHHQRACKLLKEPSSILDSSASWTFGSPSVLYMFHRTAGVLEKEVEVIKRAMPFYYQITDGHGKGAELIMEAEWYFYTGDFEDAEIAVHRAIQTATEANQAGIIISCMFLQMRLALEKGDFERISELLKKAREDINHKKWYLFMHTLDMCEAYTYSILNNKEHIPDWIAKGELQNTRLFFPTMAFLNIAYGRVLLINKEYLKLIGSADHFMKIASIFPNLLGQIHTYIYLAAANRMISRYDDAAEALKQALEIAMPDKIYMPFVENCDFIRPMLEELQIKGSWRQEIARILEMYQPHKQAVARITREYFSEAKPELSGRELQIAQLAAEGFSNKEIGEKLYISPNTVKSQLKSIFEKLGINSRLLLKEYF